MSSLEGTQFGPYHLQRLLGSGGMSEVYLAYDEATNHEVAIKVMGGNNKEYLQRFRREAEAIEKLHHPHILSAFDYDEQDPWRYLVMQYVPGGTLRDLLNIQGPLSPETTGEILTQIADALQYAHDHGILHRDIKPSNILVQQLHYPYHIYLCDFGLAKILADQHEFTQELTLSGALMGTPEYMAPDLANGAASVSSDVYALGIVLYQMLTGSVPFNGPTSIAIYWKQLREQPLPPSSLNPDLSPAIDRVILRALAKDPHYRYRSAHALAEAYMQALQRNEIEEEIFVSDGAKDDLVGTSENPFVHAQIHLVSENDANFARSLLPEPIPAYSQGRDDERPSAGNRRRADKRISEVEDSLARARRFGRRVKSRRTQSSSGQVSVAEEKDTPPLSQLPLVLPPLPTRRRRKERISQVSTEQANPAMDIPGIANPPHKVPRRASRRSDQHNQRLVIGIIALGVFLFAVLPLSIFSYLYITHAQTPVVHYNGQAHTGTVSNTTAPPNQATSVASQSNGVIFQDNLASNTPGRWTEDGTHCAFTGGAYLVSAAQNTSAQPCTLLSPLVGNASVQVDVSLQTGDSTGMLLRRNGNQFYDFEINDQGQFFFRRHDTSGTGYTTLLAPKVSRAIVPGSAQNTLRVDALWNDFKLYINGTFVGEVHDALYASGQLAFITNSSSNTDAQASYSNLLITQIG